MFDRLLLALVYLATLFGAPIALAQEAATTQPSHTTAMVADYVIQIAGTVLVALLALALRALTDWLGSRAKSERVRGIVTKLDDLAIVVVRSVQAAYVDPLRKAGTWSPQVHAEAKARALAELRSYLGPKGLDELRKVFGDDADLGAVLAGFVESALASDKRAASIAGVLPAPTTATASGTAGAQGPR